MAGPGWLPVMCRKSGAGNVTHLGALSLLAACPSRSPAQATMARRGSSRRVLSVTELSAAKQPGKAHIYDIKAVVNPEAKFEVFALHDNADTLRARIQELFATIKGKDVQFHEIERLA